MISILYTDVCEAYEISGLVPCRCGPEWHRLQLGANPIQIGGGPFMALYCQASWLIVTPDMADASLDALADAAERWARKTWGVEYYAAFQAGFEHCETLNQAGVAVCTPVEQRGLFDGKLAAQMVEAVPAPPLARILSLPASVVAADSGPGSYAAARVAYPRKAGALC